MELTRYKFAEILRERQTQASVVTKNRGERLRESGEVPSSGWPRRICHQDSLQSSHPHHQSNCLRCLRAPSSAAVTSEATGVQTSNQRKFHLRWGEHSSGSMIGSCWMLMGWRRPSMRSYFLKEVLWGKGHRIQSLAAAVQNSCSWRWGR